MTITDTGHTQPKETPMTATSAPTKNPHHVPTLITGWAVVAVILGALWGAGRDPEHAAWSGLAVVAIIAVWGYNKVRKTAFDRHSHR